MNKKLFYPLLIIAIIILVYFTSLFNGFVWLDQAEILNRKLIIPDFQAFLRMLLFDDNNYAGYHRPMYNLMHSFDYLVWKENAFGFHLSSLILHLATVLLLFKILIDISSNRHFALVAAFVFGLLPCHTATVSLIHSKADLLTAFFILFAISIISKNSLKNNKKVSWISIILFCILFFFAMLSKEVAIMLPFFAIALKILFQHKKKIISAPFYIYPILLIGVLFIGSRLSNGNNISNPDALDFIDRMLSFIPVYVNYIMLTLSGIELTTNDAILIWHQMDIAKYILYIILFFAVIWAQFKLGKKHILIAAGFLWFNLFLIPVAQIIPILHFRADRFIYIPSIGITVAIVYLFYYYYAKYDWKKYNNPLISIFTIYILLCCFNIWNRNKDFYSDETMFGELIKKHPECREAQGFVANDFLLKGNYDKALIHINLALKDQTKYYSFVDRESNLGNLGVIYLNQNKINKALEIFQKMELQESFNPVVLFNLGICHKKLKHYDEAKMYLEKYLIHKPDNIDALFNLGQIGIELNDQQMIQQYFRRYLEVNPNSSYRKLIEEFLEE